MVLADIGNSALWEEVYATDVTAEVPFPNRFLPIGKMLIPILIEKPLVAVFVDSSTANGSWNSAGWLSKNISIGLTIGNNFNTKTDFSRRLMLGQPVMIQWAGFGEQYALTFYPHKWLSQITLRIWQFMGDISQLSDEQIASLRVDILRVEQTLQFVANRDVPTIYTGTVNNDVPPQT